MVAATKERQMSYRSYYIPTDREEDAMRASDERNEARRELEAIHPDDRTDEDYRNAGIRRGYSAHREER
jgi:hypothetical protein